jgi:hypothetical protein
VISPTQPLPHHLERVGDRPPLGSDFFNVACCASSRAPAHWQLYRRNPQNDRFQDLKAPGAGPGSPSYGPRPHVAEEHQSILPYLERAAGYPGLTAVRLWRSRAIRYAGGYTAVKPTVRVGFSHLDALRHTPRPADTSTNTSSAACALSNSSTLPEIGSSLIGREFR